MAGIYIHIPFCTSKCSYCDFYSCTSTSEIDAYADALAREIHSRGDYLDGDPVRTIYFGGGTPSLLSASQISAILKEIHDIFNPTPEEITLEANPDDLTPEYLAALAQTTINRLSVGIQSFDDGHLKLMNRRHSAIQAETAIRNAQKAGFDNISADLIFGIPGMDDQTWERNIGRMISLGVQHISAYHLTIEDGTRFGKMAEKGEIAAVGDETSERQYEILRTKLGGAGFEHYEISNFALPGRRARHNSAYWKGEPYLGLGPSAHSYNGSERHVCTADAHAYIRQSPAPEMFETERLTEQDALNEYIMVRLRCAEGIELARFKEKFGAEAGKKLLSGYERMALNGHLNLKNGHIYIPPEKFLVSDSTILELFDL